ncbi:MAG: restriction endonuclease [Gallionellaceae bacterium]
MQIRFIKLGEGGCWEKSCIEEDNTIRFGYESHLHHECLRGSWDAIWEFWFLHRNDKGAATRDINQIRDFYELSETDLWITFYKRKMYWCHANAEVTELEDGTRIRNVIGSWSCNDKTGRPLAVENIDGRVTKVQGFRGTICGVDLPEYLIRKINGEIQPDVEKTQNSLTELKKNIESLISGLWWKDFELLVDLIFAKSGWQRVSVLGKTEKDIDLDIYSPVTHKRAFVQVKSSTNVSEIRNYYESFNTYEQYDEMYMVFHTLNGNIDSVGISDPSVHLLDISRISELVIHTGLIDWLITKRT